jgi:hypothetical protein
MKKSSCAIGAVTCAVIATAVVGCGGSSTPTTSSSSSSSSSASSSSTSASSSAAAAGTDYSNLLIKATDIELPGDTFTAEVPQLNPGGAPGVNTNFNNQAHTRVIGDTIVVLPDATGANTTLDASLKAMGSAVADGQPASAPVGTSGTIISGLSPDGSKAVTVLLFAEGRAVATMEFDSAPNDPVPADFVLTVGQKQDDAIKAGLPA